VNFAITAVSSGLNTSSDPQSGSSSINGVIIYLNFLGWLDFTSCSIGLGSSACNVGLPVRHV